MSVDFSAAERERFAATGLLERRAAADRDAVAAARREVFAALARLDVWSGGRPGAAARPLQALPIFQQTTRLAQRITPVPALAGLLPRALVDALPGLAGATLAAGEARPQLLVSLPQREPWTLAGRRWHLDVALPVRDEVPGVQVFVVLDDLQLHGGATLALTGSHRLPYTASGPRASALAILQRDPLWSRLLAAGPGEEGIAAGPRTLAGIDLELVELSGRAGDIYLMDMRVLHAPSINASRRPRVMASARFLRAAPRSTSDRRGSP
ncbi:MAG: hypothetical protein R3B09_09625 [Nannocystaceae bacterium]